MNIHFKRCRLMPLLYPFVLSLIGGFIYTGDEALAQEERPDAALIEKWGSIAGPVPRKYKPPAAPPPIPDTCKVLKFDEGEPGDPDVLVARYLRETASKAPDQGHQGTALDLKWRDLQQSQPGVWRGDFDLAKFEFQVPYERVVFARVNGAARLIVNGESHFVDPDRRGYLGVPIQLQEGGNELFITGIHGGFEFELWSPRTRMVIGTWDARIFNWDKVDFPFPIEMDALDSELSIPVFNASSCTADGIHFHYGHAVPGWDGDVPSMTDFRCGPGIAAPFCFSVQGSCLFDLEDKWAYTAGKVRVAICSYDDRDNDADRQVLKLDLKGEWPVYLEETGLACHELLLGTSRLSFLVYATGDQSRGTAANLACARYLQQMLWYKADRALYVIADHELSSLIHDPWIKESTLLVFVGDAKRNLAWRTLMRFDDLREFLPKDIASDEDPEEGLRLVTPAAMPKTLTRPIALIHSRSAAGLRLATILDFCGDSRLSAPSLSVVLPEDVNAPLQIERVGD